MASFSNFKSDIISTSTAAAGVELGGGITVYDSASALPLSGNEAGDQAFVKSTSRLYIHSGVGWYSVAVINTTPIISSITDENSNTTPFTLSNSGATTTITIVASDSDGETLTYNATADADFNNMAYLSQDSSVFTITPMGSDSATAESGTITFTATDGINTATSAAQTFTLTFILDEWKKITTSTRTQEDNSNNIQYLDRTGNNPTPAYTMYGKPGEGSYHPYLENWSVEYNGLDQGVYLGTTAFDNPSSTFTVEAWVYLRTIHTNASDYKNNAIIGKGATYLNFGISNNGRVQLYHYDGSTRYVLSTGTITTNEWYHVAAAVNNGTITFYINGVESGTGTWYGLHGGHVGQHCYIGTTSDGNAGADRWCDGWIANVRFTNGSNPALATTKGVPSVTGTGSFLVNASNAWKDLAGNFTPTLYGEPVISAFNAFSNTAEYLPDQSLGSLSFGTSDGQAFYVNPTSLGTTWTVEFWYQFDNDSTIDANHYLFDARASGTLYLYRTAANTYSSPGVTWGITDDNLNDGGWHWFTMSCDGTNTTVWIDGTRIATSATTATIGTILFLNSRQTDQYHNKCHYADFRVSTTARYAYTATTITVPTEPVGHDSNTGSYYRFDNAGILDKTSNKNIILKGTCRANGNPTHFGNNTIYLDAGDNYFYTKQHDYLFNSDCTIEWWHYAVTAPNANSTLMAQGYTGSNPYGWVIFASGAGNYAWYSSTGSQWTINGTSTGLANNATGQWRHYAVVNDGGTMKFFSNGALATSFTLGHTIGATNNERDLYFGANVGGLYSHGGAFFIDGFQVSRFAKYTTTFSPPTNTQTSVYQITS